jgi:hypothetical protein
MRWLVRPKEYASYVSAVAKLATKDQVGKLLQKQADGEEVHLFGCMVKVSSFHDEKVPRETGVSAKRSKVSMAPITEQYTQP